MIKLNKSGLSFQGKAILTMIETRYIATTNSTLITAHFNNGKEVFTCTTFDREFADALPNKVYEIHLKYSKEYGNFKLLQYKLSKESVPELPKVDEAQLDYSLLNTQLCDLHTANILKSIIANQQVLFDVVVSSLTTLEGFLADPESLFISDLSVRPHMFRVAVASNLLRNTHLDKAMVQKLTFELVNVRISSNTIYFRDIDTISFILDKYVCNGIRQGGIL